MHFCMINDILKKKIFYIRNLNLTGVSSQSKTCTTLKITQTMEVEDVSKLNYSFIHLDFAHKVKKKLKLTK